MIAKIKRGGGFLGCLNYVLRTRKQDKGKYEKDPGGGSGQVGSPDGGLRPTILRVYWHGAYRGTIIDRGNNISLARFVSKKMAAYKAAEVAAEKGWKSAWLSGSDDFVKHGYEYLLARGIEPKPKDAHQQKILNEVQRERAETGRDKWKQITLPLETKNEAQEKASAPQIVGGNMGGDDAKNLAWEFGQSRRERPEIKKPVWHLSLSLAPAENLEPEKWKELSAKFMRRMGFSENHQYISVRHFDRKEDHIHIVASRIGLDGKLWQGRWEAKKAHQITNELAVEFGLKEVEIKKPSKKAPSMAEISKSERTGQPPERLILQKLIDTALAGKPTTKDFLERLKNAGVVVRPNIAKTGRMNGFSFAVSGSKIFFSGSKLGKAYTWRQIKEAINYEQDKDSTILGRAKDRASAGADGANPRSAGAGHNDFQTQKNGSRNNPANGVGGAGDQRGSNKSPADREKNEKNIKQGRQNKRNDHSFQVASRKTSPGQNLAGGFGKQPGRGSNRGSGASSTPPLKTWQFQEPFSFLDEWWISYKEAKPKCRKIIKSQAQNILLQSYTNISPVFSDNPEEYYVKAIAEILTKSPGATKLTAKDMDYLVEEIMKRRDRPKEQIKSVLNQSPLGSGGTSPRNVENEKIISEIAQKIAPTRPKASASAPQEDYFTP